MKQLTLVEMDAVRWRVLGFTSAEIDHRLGTNTGDALARARQKRGFKTIIELIVHLIKCGELEAPKDMQRVAISITPEESLTLELLQQGCTKIEIGTRLERPQGYKNEMRKCANFLIGQIIRRLEKKGAKVRDEVHLIALIEWQIVTVRT